MAELGIRADHSDIIVPGEKPDRAGSHRFGGGTAAPGRRAGIAGAGVSGAQGFKDLFPPRGRGAVKFDPPGPNQENPFAGLPFTEKDLPFIKTSFLQAGLNAGQVAFRKFVKDRNVF